MPYQQVTLAQLRGLVQAQLGAAATVFWCMDELNRIINEGLRFFQACTGYWRVTDVALGTGAPKVTVADQVWYSIPGTITSGMRLRFNGKPLTPAGALDALDQGRPSWESETTASGGSVPTEPQQWAVAGLNLIAIWPADHAGGNALWADGVAQTPSLVADGDFVNLGEQELNGLLDYCQHIAVFKEGGAEFEATMPQMQEFMKNAAATNAALMASSLFRRFMGADDARASNPRRAETERVGER